MERDILYFLWKYIDLHALILPIGIIGVWRWSVWLFKEVVALKYNPVRGSYKGDVTIITPVYNEDPAVFKKALKSWEKNNPKKIIAVIDHTDKEAIEVFRNFSSKNKISTLVVTKIPGKRPALSLGIKKAKTDIVALVDSDTIWGKNVIINALSPFADKKVAGVGTYQSVLSPKTLAQRIFDTQLDLRYSDDMAFLGAAGNALICLSGRTAFYKRKIITPMLPKLVHETFMGRPVISGDDKRLTYLVLAAGWKVKFQSNSHVYTPGMKDLNSYLKQRLRWSRNSLRADLKAIKEGWPFRHKALVFFQFDKLAQAIVTLLSPIYFLIALFTGLWMLSAVIMLWWIVSRAIKMYPHLRRRPQDITILPVFILLSFLIPGIKVYALLTMNTQGWITRWDKSRLQQLRFIKLLPAYAGTLAIILLIALGVFFEKQYTFFIPQEEQKKLIAAVLPQQRNIAYANNNKILGVSTAKQKDLLTRKHVYQYGDSFYSIAQKYGITVYNLLNANTSRITNWNRLELGFMFNIPGKDMDLYPQNYNYQRVYPDYLGISYDDITNTVTVSGRGMKITLNDLKNNLSEDQLREVSPKVWYLKANLYLRSGIALTLDKNEVKWLKLKSTKDKFVFIRGSNSFITINGVKISSWDDSKNDYDHDIKDGRSYIMVKDNSRMDIYNSDLGYLGYSRPKDLDASPYGVSWKMSKEKLLHVLLTGEVINSRFHHNYFGAYTFGATGMTWRNNEFDHNVRYGLDPHDDSNGFLVERNSAHNNGTHGIIFSKRCVDNIIRNNISYNNTLHGIVLHEKSDNNIIEDNFIYGNANGIAIYHSSNNFIQGNNIRDNRYGIRLKDASIKNNIQKNKITASTMRGIDIYNDAEQNVIEKNTFKDNNTAVSIKTNKNVVSRNYMENNNIGVYFLETAAGNAVFENRIIYSTQYGIYAKNRPSFSNTLGINTLYRNRKDVVAKKPLDPKISKAVTN